MFAVCVCAVGRKCNIKIIFSFQLYAWEKRSSTNTKYVRTVHVYSTVRNKSKYYTIYSMIQYTQHTHSVRYRAVLWTVNKTLNKLILTCMIRYCTSEQGVQAAIVQKLISTQLRLFHLIPSFSFVSPEGRSACEDTGQLTQHVYHDIPVLTPDELYQMYLACVL